MPLRSLRALTIAFLILFLATTIATALATHAATQAAIIRLVDRRIADASIAVAGAASPPRPAAVLERIADFGRQRDTGDLGFELMDGRGRRLGGNVRLKRRLPAGYSSLGADAGVAGLSEGRALALPIGGGMTLTTIAETEPIDDYHVARIRIYLLGFGAIILVVVGGTILFAGLVGRRIGQMRRTVDAIFDGDIRRRLPIDGSGSEFDEQARAFNRMLDRIAALMETIASVSNDIAHDLRTPLARLHGQLRLLARRAESPAQRRDLEAALDQGDQLLAMFAAVLRIAEIEGGDRRAGFAPLDLGALATEIGTMMRPVAEDSAHRIELERCDAAPIDGDRQLLSQLLINLIENGLRHTPSGTRIGIGVAVRDGRVNLTVRDDGPGIAADLRALALRRFGRLDRSRGGAGHGLGLALVEAIARLHGGDLLLDDARPGLAVIVSLPRA